MGDSTTERLALALEQAGAPASLVAQARAGQFDDFRSSSATPISDLVRRCRQLGLTDVAKRAIAGEFDATKEEAEEWMRSPEGQRTMRGVV